MNKAPRWTAENTAELSEQPSEGSTLNSAPLRWAWRPWVTSAIPYLHQHHCPLVRQSGHQYIWGVHTGFCIKRPTQTFPSASKPDAAKEKFDFPLSSLNPSQWYTPLDAETPTAEVRLQSSSKTARHIANCYKTARSTGRGKDYSFQSERKAIFDLKKYFNQAVSYLYEVPHSHYFLKPYKSSAVQTSSLTSSLLPAWILTNQLFISSEQKQVDSQSCESSTAILLNMPGLLCYPAEKHQVMLIRIQT